MKPRLIIIGDSFAKGVNDGSFYADILKERFQWIEVIHDGASSRDAQTIIDHWIKVIPEIRPDDYLVIIIPMLERSRLPLVEKHQTPVAIGKTILVNRFVGTASYNNEEIEIFGDSFGVDYYKNLTVIDLNEVLQLNKLFAMWDTYYNPESFDLYFLGIKKDKFNLYVNSVNTSSTLPL